MSAGKRESNPRSVQIFWDDLTSRRMEVSYNDPIGYADLILNGDTVKLLADSGPEFAGVLPAEANKDSFCRMRDIMHVKDCNGINPMLQCNYSCIIC